MSLTSYQNKAIFIESTRIMNGIADLRDSLCVVTLFFLLFVVFLFIFSDFFHSKCSIQITGIVNLRQSAYACFFPSIASHLKSDTIQLNLITLTHKIGMKMFIETMEKIPVFFCLTHLHFYFFFSMTTTHLLDNKKNIFVGIRDLNAFYFDLKCDWYMVSS